MMAHIGTVYFFGVSDEKTGRAIKIGHTNGPLAKRKSSLLTNQLARTELHLLVAVPGTSTHERAIHDYFSQFADDANSTETFKIVPELMEYLNWLRQQWWVYLNESDIVDQIPTFDQWGPNLERRVPFTEDDRTELLPKNITYVGPLANKEPWNRLSTPSPTGDDFYTPVELVEAARTAMGGIDLDPASHWRANKVHKIPLYYHVNRSAHENEWLGRVWLNPPYGNNAPWFKDIITHWDSGKITQLCMVSPVWVFTTQMAKPIMRRSSAMILLTPTPTFWGHPDGNTGINHPHAIIYLGPRTVEFRDAFVKYGIPVKFDFSPTDYDASKDIDGSLTDAYRAIAGRKAAGGTGWNSP